MVVVVDVLGNVLLQLLSGVAPVQMEILNFQGAEETLHGIVQTIPFS